MQEAGVQILGWEDALEKATANHSSIFACRITWTEELGRRGYHEVAKSQTQLSDFLLQSMLY